MPSDRLIGSMWATDRGRRPDLCQRNPPSVAEQIMRNTSNTYYLNSTVFTILWQVQQRDDVRIPNAWNRAMAGGNWTPVNFLRFQLIGWRQPHNQHDAAEFIQFLLPKLAWIGDVFSWGARLQVGGLVETVLRSGNAHILMMATADGLCSSNIQLFINQWHAQAHTHGLNNAPQHLYLQLPRYRDTQDGIVKHLIPLDLNTRAIQLPIFNSQDSTEVHWKQYDITTAIVHLGPNQRAGHYRVSAFLPNNPGRWYSNDNQTAERLSAIPGEVKEQCYILGCLAR